MPRRLEAELSRAAVRTRIHSPSTSTRGESAEETSNCKLSSRLIVFASSLVALALALALLVTPAASPLLLDSWVLSQITCSQAVNRTVAYNRTIATRPRDGTPADISLGNGSAVQQQPRRPVEYTVGTDQVYLTNEAIDSVRSRFRAILAMALLMLVSSLLGLMSALTPDLQAESARCRMMTFVGFSLPASIAALFVALYCFGFRRQANYIARLYFDCLKPALPARITTREQLDLDNELLLAGYALSIGSACLVASAYWGGHLLGWRRISRSTMLACNTFSMCIGGGTVVIGFMSMGGGSAGGVTVGVTAGDFVLVGFGVLIAMLSALGLAAARAESVPLCRMYARLGGLFTALTLALAVVFFLYPEAMDALLVSHWAAVSGAFGGMSKAEYDALVVEHATFIGTLTTVVCTILVLNMLAAFTYRHALEKGTHDDEAVPDVEFVNITARRKEREAAFRARLAEEGAASDAVSAARAGRARGGAGGAAAASARCELLRPAERGVSPAASSASSSAGAGARKPLRPADGGAAGTRKPGAPRLPTKAAVQDKVASLKGKFARQPRKK
ncbi:hypothetical protein KFE25_002072 [Diacronema lutheri]|uniref:Uncharacterized protein n=1 Tax=Diacronema lutheri TaxID=2081491 RepID=A0A8J5XCT6_DIALT|nr:hypothetical protein KFE25_002072 [Diacronema lutheri]